MEQATLQNKIICPTCGSEMVLKSTSKFTHKDGTYKKFYGCKRFPACRETHGAHPNGQPLGIPVQAEARKLRTKVHRLLSIVISGQQEYNKLTKQQKIRTVIWLEKRGYVGHIGQMQKADLEGLLLSLENEVYEIHG